MKEIRLTEIVVHCVECLGNYNRGVDLILHDKWSEFDNENRKVCPECGTIHIFERMK
jgi:O-acetyl-ADP-ribose deacetylase (regulator of RNase III)